MAGDVFGVGGGEAAAVRLGVPFLGRVNLAPVVRESGDKGEPVVACCPDTEQAEVFRQIAQTHRGPGQRAERQAPCRSARADQARTLT